MIYIYILLGALIASVITAALIVLVFEITLRVSRREAKYSFYEILNLTEFAFVTDPYSIDYGIQLRKISKEFNRELWSIELKIDEIRDYQINPESRFNKEFEEASAFVLRNL